MIKETFCGGGQNMWWRALLGGIGEGLQTKETWGGGLGVLNLCLMNHYMLTKWWWRYYTKTNNLGGSSFKHLYFTHVTSSQASEIANMKASPVWKSVMKTRKWFFSSTCLSLGSGNQISLWHDAWMPKRTIEEHLPNPLYINQKIKCFGGIISTVT